VRAKTFRDYKSKFIISLGSKFAIVKVSFEAHITYTFHLSALSQRVMVDKSVREYHFFLAGRLEQNMSSLKPQGWWL